MGAEVAQLLPAFYTGGLHINRQQSKIIAILKNHFKNMDRRF